MHWAAAFTFPCAITLTSRCQLHVGHQCVAQLPMCPMLLQQPDAKEQFMAAKEAFQVLSDAETRGRHDRQVIVCGSCKLQVFVGLLMKSVVGRQAKSCDDAAECEAAGKRGL